MRSATIDLSLVQKLESLELRARYIVEGFLNGLNRSPLRGFSAEFAEYRHYFPGDPLKLVDWKVFGRSDRFYIKQFEEETNLQCHLVLDVSGSMNYRSRPQLLTKIDYARTVAAALGLFLKRQRDTVGLTLCMNDGISFIPSHGSSVHLHQLLSRLETIQATGEVDFAAGVESFANLLKRRSFVVLISDFYEEPCQLESALRRLRFDHHEVIAFQVLDPMEVEFQFTESSFFHDLETGAQLVVDPTIIRSRYLEQFTRHQEEIVKSMRNYEVDMTQFRTDDSPESALSAYLAKREGRL